MITWEKLTSILEYDKDNGLWRWKVPIKGKMKKGWFDGTMNGEGYLQICIEGKIYLLHRLAWFYVYHNWPDKIDHRFHDLTNNRIKNLRDSSSLQNNWNRKTCGSIKIKGVCFNSKANNINHQYGLRESASF